MVNGKLFFLALLPTSCLVFSASMNMSQPCRFPGFSLGVSLALSWPGLMCSCVFFIVYKHCSFSFHFRSLLNSSAATCLSASVSICPTPEFLFLYFLIKSMFNIIPMLKCILFQLQIEFICLSWKSFTQPQGLRNKGSLKSHSSVSQSFYQNTNWWSYF